MLLSLLLTLWSADLADLGSDDWPAREAAHSRLYAAMPLSWPATALYRTDDPETNRRRDTLLAPLFARLEGTARTALVLWLVYSPDLADETWADLEWYAWDQMRVHDDVLAFAVQAGLLRESERRSFYVHPTARAWKGEAFCRRLHAIRWRARVGPAFPF